jgi:hypothetical protein
MSDHDMTDEREDIAAELTETVDALRSLPKEATPPRDLWPEIQARISAHGQVSTVTAIGTHASWWNRSVSAPWAMAASVIFATAIGAVTWQVAQRGAPEVIAGVQLPTTTGVVRPVADDLGADLALPEYDLAVTGLRQAYEAGKERLAPETVEVLEQSLNAIDDAIAEARAAIEADPARAEVRRILYNNLNRKLDVLRQAAAAVQNQA